MVLSYVVLRVVLRVVSKLYTNIKVIDLYGFITRFACSAYSCV